MEIWLRSRRKFGFWCHSGFLILHVHYFSSPVMIRCKKQSFLERIARCCARCCAASTNRIVLFASVSAYGTYIPTFLWIPLREDVAELCQGHKPFAWSIRGLISCCFPVEGPRLSSTVDDLPQRDASSTLHLLFLNFAIHSQAVHSTIASSPYTIQICREIRYRIEIVWTHCIVDAENALFDR